MKNQKGFVQIILALVVIGLAIGGVYYFGTLKNKTDLSLVIPTPTASQSPAGDMVNWKTYTGKVFEYKYPDFLYGVDQKTNDSVYLYKNKQAGDEHRVFPLIQIGYSIENEIPNSSDYTSYVNLNGLTITKNKQAIGGQAKSTVLEAYLTKNLVTYKISIQTTPTGYWETLYPNDKFTENEVVTKEFTLLNQILSTFKFTK